MGSTLSALSISTHRIRLVCRSCIHLWHQLLWLADAECWPL